MVNNGDTWTKITTVYLSLKQIIIRSEEFDRELDTPIQPILEQRSALDHIIRAQVVRLGQRRVDDPEDYVKKQLDKALGHLYRAFFDAADSYSIDIRDDIRSILSNYSTETITAVIPQYYKDWRPTIVKASESITILRGNKDIVQPDQIISEVAEYENVLNNLFEISERINLCVPDLEDCKRKKTKKTIRSFVLAIGGSLVVAVVVWTATYFGILPSQSQQAEQTLTPPAATSQKTPGATKSN